MMIALYNAPGTRGSLADTWPWFAWGLNLVLGKNFKIPMTSSL
jgi:hypothetical protein